MSMTFALYVNSSDPIIQEFFKNLSNTVIADDGIGRYLTLDECESAQIPGVAYFGYPDKDGFMSVLSLQWTNHYRLLAGAVGIESLLWGETRPSNQYASVLAVPIVNALTALRSYPGRYKEYETEYASLGEFVIILEKILMAAVRFPKATIYKHF